MSDLDFKVQLENFKNSHISNIHLIINLIQVSSGMSATNFCHELRETIRETIILCIYGIKIKIFHY